MNKFTIGVLVTVAGASAFLSSGAPGLGKAVSDRFGADAPARNIPEGRAAPLAGQKSVTRP